PMINRRVTITGKVQGVSFRKATFEMAVRLGVFGYVKNVDQDKVFVEAEGNADAVFKLIDFCHHGPENAEVEHRMNSATILVTGACGQIGSELVMALRARGDNVIATDLKVPSGELLESGEFQRLDVLNKNSLAALVSKYKVNQIYHLAALLSATGEQNPELAWRVNMKGLRNILDCSVELGTKAGGGTTDYAVEIFFEALKHKKYNCFLSENTVLPMMYMPDAIRGTIELMDAPDSNLSIRSAYNFSAFSFSPQDLAKCITAEIPDFLIQYTPDFRQAIADSWPASIDDSFAQKDWAWKPAFTLEEMTKDMLSNIVLRDEI
ncbi:unnamed protein product, partial [Darwinula stevensoni]